MVMKLYPSLFAYLGDRPPISLATGVIARDRPILVLDSPQLSGWNYANNANTNNANTNNANTNNANTNNANKERLRGLNLLAAISGRGAYEIVFPYLATEDNFETLEQTCDLAIRSGQSLEVASLRVADEVIDGTAISESRQLERIVAMGLGDAIDDTVSPMLQSLAGLFASLGESISLEQLNDRLAHIDLAEATLPLIVSLNRRYKLHQKLDAIASKLRHQLRRRAELMPVARIQEMDAYCLRDYIRRPGRSLAEKAGEKQELMGVNRYGDRNTPENKFLLYFAGKLLRLECSRYENSKAQQYRSEVMRLRHSIERLIQRVEVKDAKAATDRLFTRGSGIYLTAKPNYVLLQNTLYSSFYRAYLDYMRYALERERVWPFRNQLLADGVYACLAAALMRLPGASAKPDAKLLCRLHPDEGRYLIDEVNPLEIRVLANQQERAIALRKPRADEPKGDFIIAVETKERSLIKLPVWVFWYSPREAALAEAKLYLDAWPNCRMGLLLYLQDNAKQYSAIGDIGYAPKGKIWLFQLAAPAKERGFVTTVDFLVELLNRWLWLAIS